MLHADALTAQVSAAPVLNEPAHAATLNLARTLAAQMDAAGADPSTRLSAAYLSVLKDLGRIAATKSNAKSSEKSTRLRALREGNAA